MQDRIDVGVAEIREDIHRGTAVGIVQVVEINVARGKNFGVVMDPVVQELLIGHPGGDAFERRARDYFDGVVTLSAIGLKEGFAGFRLRRCRPDQ